MSSSLSNKQKLAHELVLRHADENYADIARRCKVSTRVVNRVFALESAEASVLGRSYGICETTLDKIIEGLS